MHRHCAETSCIEAKQIFHYFEAASCTVPALSSNLCYLQAVHTTAHSSVSRQMHLEVSLKSLATHTVYVDRSLLWEGGLDVIFYSIHSGAERGAG